VAAWAQGSQDFGTGVPAWAQLSAVAVLVVLMAIALRVAYRFANGAYLDAVKRADAAQDDLETLNREMRTSVVPALVEANRTMLRVIALLDERR